MNNMLGDHFLKGVSMRNRVRANNLNRVNPFLPTLDLLCIRNMNATFAIIELVQVIISFLKPDDARRLTSTCKLYSRLRKDYTLFKKVKSLLKAQAATFSTRDWYTIYSFHVLQTPPPYITSSLICKMVPCYVMYSKERCLLLYKGWVGVLSSDFEDFFKVMGFYRVTSKTLY